VNGRLLGSIFVSFLLVSMLFWRAASGARMENLIVNGDFERGYKAWQPDRSVKRYGKFGIESDPKRSGKVMRVENAGADATVGVFQTIRVRPKKMYELTGFSRSTKLQEGGGIAFHCLDHSGKLIKRVWVHNVPSWGIPRWQAFWGQFVPPKGTAAIQIKLVVYKKGKVWFDDLSLVEKDRPKKVRSKGKPIKDGGMAITRFATKRPVYAMDADDLDGDGSAEFLLGDIDGTLRCQRADGRVLWERDMGGLVLALDCGDLDGDGAEEIAACTADTKGNLRVMNSRGQTLWTYAVPGTMFAHVTVSDLDGDGKCEVFATHDNQLLALSPKGKLLWQRSFGGPRFKAVAVGDVTGDGKNEVVASLSSQGLFAVALKADGKQQWTYRPREFRRLNPDDILITDLDGDGRREVVMASAGGLVICIRDGKTVWAATREKSKLWPKHRDATANLRGQAARIVVADFCPDRPGLETLVALLDTVWLLNKDGKYIWEGDSGILVRSLTLGPKREVFVPSSGFRDASLYKLAFARGKGNPLAKYVVPNPIYDRLEKMYRQVRSMKPLPRPSGVKGKFHVIYANLPAPWGRWGSYERLEEVHKAVKSLENERLEFILMLWPKDLPVELHRSGMIEQDAVLKAVRYFERVGCPFMFFIDHGCSPNLSLDTIEKTLRLAPKTCRGMYVAENTAYYPSAKWDEFVEWAMKVMDLCKKYGGRKMVFKEMFESWAFLPADPKVRNTLLQPKYKNTIVALYATNNPYAPELQIGGMVGLEQAGLVSGWGISTQYWNWSWDAHRTAQNNWTICPADVIMSMELSSACLGGRWFHIEGGQEYLDRTTGELLGRAKRHRDLVYELVRKNVLLPVRDDDNLSFSNIVLVRRHHPLVDKLRASGARLGPPYGRPLGPLRRGLLGVNDALQTAPADFFSTYAYRHRRYTQTMVPRTPFGYVRIVPECGRVRPFLAGKRTIRTDGCDVFIEGKRMSASAAKERILSALNEEAYRLPVHTPGAAVFAHRVGNGYRVFLLDPGYMCPVGVEATLTLTVPAKGLTARDLLSGRRLPAHGNAVAVKVAPGAFRVVEITPR